MDKIKIFEELIKDGNVFNFDNFSKKSRNGFPESFSTDYLKWKARVEASLFKHIGVNNQATDYYFKAIIDDMLGNYSDEFDINHGYIMTSLETAIDLIKYDLLDITQKVQPDVHLERVFERFHSVCKQLRDRYSNRPTLDVQDEYDVQDLLHSLLRLYFDDIRPEEWTPSYAGSSSRMDFLLKNENSVIEVKKTRVGLGPKELGEQLIIDIEKYKGHPNCKTLYCFTYDPEGRIPNPKGIETDLTGQRDKMKVIVKIFPK